jgi:hypothetical protein
MIRRLLKRLVVSRRFAVCIGDKFSLAAKEFNFSHQSFFSIILVGLTLFLNSLPARAQETMPEPGAGESAQIIVSVEPKHGNQIPVITQQDVMVYQGHDRLTVTGWVPAKGDRAGLALAILIDESAGFSLGTQLSDIRNFITEQPPSTLIAVGYMQNGTVKVACDFTADHTAAAKSVRLTLGYFGAEGSPYLSLSEFIKRWHSDSPSIRREVLMITSGIDNVYMGNIGNPYVDAAVQNAQCGGVVIYSIYTPSAGHMGHSYFRTYWGENYLSELSEMTGGESYYILGPQAPVSFVPYLKKLNEQLPNQFLLSFQPKPEKKAGLESIKVTSEIHDVDFLHQNNVCVQAEPKD